MLEENDNNGESGDTDFLLDLEGSDDDDDDLNDISDQEDDQDEGISKTEISSYQTIMPAFENIFCAIVVLSMK